jgi:hypothetical protein
MGYRLILNDCISRSARPDSIDNISQAVLGLLQRIPDDRPTEVHAMWSTWPSLAFQQSLIALLRQLPYCRLKVVLDPDMMGNGVDSARGKEQPLQQFAHAAEGAQVQLIATQRSEQAYRAQMRNNWMLFKDLAPQNFDDGSFGILFMDAALPATTTDCGVSEAVWLYGDSSLYERFRVYWHAIAEGKTETMINQSHTYSNLHDHLVWFFPDINAANTALSILAELAAGIAETQQPAKVRLVLAGIDDHHLAFIAKLKELQEQYELDLKIIVGEQVGAADSIFPLRDAVPAGCMRYFTGGDSLQAAALHSRFLLIDGPYPMGDNSPAEPRKLCFFFGDDLNLEHMQQSSATWLRIMDRRLFEEAEDHFDRLWEMSQDTL